MYIGEPPHALADCVFTFVSLLNGVLYSGNKIMSLSLRASRCEGAPLTSSTFVRHSAIQSFSEAFQCSTAHLASTNCLYSGPYVQLVFFVL